MAGKIQRHLYVSFLLTSCDLSNNACPQVALRDIWYSRCIWRFYHKEWLGRSPHDYIHQYLYRAPRRYFGPPGDGRSGDAKYCLHQRRWKILDQAQFWIERKSCDMYVPTFAPPKIIWFIWLVYFTYQRWMATKEFNGVSRPLCLHISDSFLAVRQCHKCQWGHISHYLQWRTNICGSFWWTTPPPLPPDKTWWRIGLDISRPAGQFTSVEQFLGVEWQFWNKFWDGMCC